jgi:hypothetical protein
MGGREIGLGLGLWGAMRAQRPTRPWLVAGVLSDGSDMAGIVGAWQHMAPSKRWPGVTFAGIVAATGPGLIAAEQPS